jgi:hypothetical protein
VLANVRRRLTTSTPRQLRLVRNIDAEQRIRECATEEPYPATQDQRYERALRVQVADILENRSHPAATLLNRKAIEDMLARPAGATSSVAEHIGLERARWIRAWMTDYGVILDM